MDDQLTAERRRVTYTIYIELHASRASFPKKTLRAVFTEMMYADPSAWRAVGITRAALDTYRAAGKNKVQGVERAHLTDRWRMVEHVFERETPLTEDELFAYWEETDRVVIALRGENRQNVLGDWIPFANDDGRLFPRLGIGFKYRNDIEGEIIRKLAQEIEANA